MYISLNWIKEFVNLDGISDEELVKRFTMSTAEIEGVVKKGADMEDVVVAEIVETRKYEGSDHLNIMKVDDGSGEYLQILTGAPNVYKGMRTFLVRIGGMVAGHKIKLAKLAGKESYGMCCSEAELGIGSDDEGIVDYKGDAKNGTPIKEILPIDDTIIEIDNKSLSNRPDLWGHYGIAREFACIFDRKLKNIDSIDLTKFEGLKEVSINIENKNCFRYSAITVDNIKKHISPYFMKIRLNYCGMRDINLLADMTNYIMLEVGQPMHAFDNKLVKGINVISGDGKTKMTTLEGEEHILPEGAIIIADQKKNPVAIAGIKGGLLSGINEKTTSLLLESATFDAATIRKTAKKVGLATDSSQRYEKSLDPELCSVATGRLLYILSKICPDMVVTSAYSSKSTFNYPVRKIKFTREFIVSRGGEDVSSEFITNTLKKLGFKVKTNGEDYEVTVPSFRATKDVTMKEDIVEEIYRIFGYDNIKPKTILSKTIPVAQDKTVMYEYEIKKLLAEKYDANEVHSYIWNYADFNKHIGVKSKSVISLVDASNSGQSGIRSEIMPTLIKFYHENKNNFDELTIDEIGSVAESIGENGLVNESRRLGVLSASLKSAKDQYFLMKQIVLNIASSIIKTKISFDMNFDRPNYIHPVNSAAIVVNGEKIGYIGLLHPQVVRNIETKANIGVIELDYKKLVNAQELNKIIKPVSKFQSISMDFTFLVPKTMLFSQIEKAISEFRCKFDVTYSLVDIYENEALGENRAYTIKFDVTPLEHTLSSNEIDNFRKRILDHMNRFGLNLR